jgi:hypothetical protein
MAGFREAAAFAPTTGLQLLPLRFERLRADRYFVSNIVGEGLLLSQEQLDRVVSLDLSPGDGLYERAFEKLLVSAKGQRSQLQLLAMRLRSRMAFLQQPTALHIFVVTLRCEHSCPYCQVSRRSVDRERFDMNESTAMACPERGRGQGDRRSLSLCSEGPPLGFRQRSTARLCPHPAGRGLQDPQRADPVDGDDRDVPSITAVQPVHVATWMEAGNARARGAER